MSFYLIHAITLYQHEYTVYNGKFNRVDTTNMQ